MSDEPRDVEEELAEGWRFLYGDAKRQREPRRPLEEKPE